MSEVVSVEVGRDCIELIAERNPLTGEIDRIVMNEDDLRHVIASQVAKMDVSRFLAFPEGTE